LLIAGLLIAVASSGHGANVYLFEVAPGEQRTVTAPTTGTLEEQGVALDMFYSYARTPLEGRIAGEDLDLVKSRHSVQAALTYGLRDDLQVSLRTPYAISQRTDHDDVSGSGFGDTVLSAKYRLPWRAEDVGFAVAPHYRFNSGRSSAFMSGDDEAVGLRAISDIAFNERLHATANVGYEYRSPMSVAQVDIKHTLLYGTGLVFDVPEMPAYFTGEILGRSERLDRARHSPVEALLSAGYEPFGNVTLTGGMGHALNNGYGASDWRFFSGLRVRF